MYTALACHRNLHTGLVIPNAAHTNPFSGLTNKCKHMTETNVTALKSICSMNEWRKEWEINGLNPTNHRLKTELLHTCSVFLVDHCKNVRLHDRS